MNLKDYLWNSLVEEQSTVEELLRVDNKVCHMNLSYFQLLGNIEYSFPIAEQVYGDFDIITDGDPDTVFQALVTFGGHIHHIHVNRNFLGVNTWLVEKTKKYYQEQGTSVDITLDESHVFEKYVNEKSRIILYGFKEFVESTKEILQNHQLIEIYKWNGEVTC